jgi:hypothetical protein
MPHIEIAAQVPPRDVASLQGATEVRFTGSGGEHAVKLLRISPAISREARSVDVRLAFAGKAGCAGRRRTHPLARSAAAPAGRAGVEARPGLRRLRA